MNKTLFGMAIMAAFFMASCANKPAQQQEEAADENAATGNEIRINCLYKVAPDPSWCKYRGYFAHLSR